MNARKSPVRFWQVSNSAAAGDGVIDGDEVFVWQIDGADRDSQREDQHRRNDEFQGDRFVDHRGDRRPRSPESGKLVIEKSANQVPGGRVPAVEVNESFVRGVRCAATHPMGGVV